MPDSDTRQKDLEQTLHNVMEMLKNNREHFWQIAEAIPNIVVIINTSGEISYVNNHITDAFGYHPEELIHKSVDILIPPDVRKKHSAHLKVYFKNPSNRPMGKGMELFAYHKDQSVFPVEIGLGYISLDGKPQSIAIITDITERKQAEEILRERERLLKQAEEIAHIGSWEVNLDTGKCMWSDEFFRICGYKPQSLVPSAELGFTIIHPDDREKASLAFEETQKTMQPYNIEKRIVRPNGDIRWVNSHGEIIVDEVTGHRHLSGVFIDITEQKVSQERELELQLERERLRLLTNFIQNISHEFRTPLTIINSTAHLMAYADDREKRFDKAELIQQQVLRTSSLIDILLTMVELESDKPIDFTPIKIANTVEAVCHSMRENYGKTRHIIFEKPIHSPIIIGHAIYIFDALSQIIDNACRYTPEDGTITIILGQDEDTIYIRCEDTGVGIKEEDLPNIFLSFWRYDKAHYTPGFGLGLPMAKTIIEKHHHGTIEVDSVLDQGTVFLIRLPIGDPNDNRIIGR